ncbi:tubulin-specific chaperone D [Chloropicon primus]|uniref:Tubulin-specific chaperone D n=3 Tax=Chloropicon primus TaxID=1764295 RepID=A0A5B8MML1_9CHLO|nr:tubulin-specific chaperone D [Chloropicon primus]|eukprot:QDZ21898.1 tubulin-specific chaperone D [Chloropicon primus]
MLDGEEVGGEGSLVKEAEEMKGIVLETVGEAEGGGGGKQARRQVDRFKGMIEKYKEQSTLLDPHLKDLVLPLSSALKRLSHEHLYGSSREAGSNAVEVLTQVVRVCKLLHMITTVRGYKTVKKFYPSAPEDVEPAFYMLQSLKEASEARPDGYDEMTLESFWEAHCTLLLWLSLLVLIPFDLATIDTGDAGSGASSEAGKSIVLKILGTCKVFLQNAGLVRDMSAYLLSQLLTRPDSAHVLKEFLEWSQANLSQDASRASDVFLTLGISCTIAAIFKHGSRLSLLPIAPLAWQVIETLESLPESKNNSLIRKLRCKLLCRVGLINLRPRLATWRYSLGSRITDGAIQGRQADAKADGEDYVEDEEDIDCIEEVEELIGSFLENLCDKDTIVRWSAAKGIGRIASRLPKDMIADIIDSILELFTKTEGDGAWHGGCLALAELAWRGLLLPQQLEDVIPKVVEALQYDVKRGAHSVGSHVRDAGCYVFWAFSRSYSSDIMGQYLPTIAKNLLVLSCFDREINCRRAASAAFQELVGRQGNIPNGIEALTIADYFTVSARKSAYLSVAPQIAAFKEYSRSLAEHLLDAKMFHWEKVLRELAAKALATLLPTLGESFGHEALGVLLLKTSDLELDVKHGAIVGLAELLPIMKEEGYELTEDEIQKIASLIERVDETKYYRGKGGTIIYEAVCCFLDGVCRAHVKLPESVVSRIDHCISFSLKHLSTLVQDYAVTAFKSLCSAYYASIPIETQIEVTATKYMGLIGKERNSLLCQGYILALGSCPANILWPCAKDVLDCLKTKAVPCGEDDGAEVEARVAAVKGITFMCRTLSDSAETEEQRKSLTGLLYDKMIPCLLETINDYTIDNRGDIGSWVRHESMEAIEVSLSALGSVAGEDDRSPSTSGKRSIETTALGALIKQSLEKIDRIRHAAYLHTRKILSIKSMAKNVECWTELQEIYEPDADHAGSGNLFEHLLEILRLEPYRNCAIQGLALSAGGLGDSVSQTAVGAMVKSVNEGGDSMLLTVAWELQAILARNAGVSRVVIPVMRTIDFLFSKAGLIDSGDVKLFEALLAEAWGSTRGCRDIVLLQVALSLIANLTYAKDPVFTASFYKLIASLVNRYPKIRRCAAEHLYMRIISFEEEEEEKFDVDRATELVTEVSWDTGAAAAIKTARLDLFACFGMEPPKKIETSKVQVEKKDNAMTSYASLVANAGY